jgi:hypothetical protein
MSGINGDKARFNRHRKKKIARRTRNEKRWKAEGVNTKTPSAPKKAAS